MAGSKRLVQFARPTKALAAGMKCAAIGFTSTVTIHGECTSLAMSLAVRPLRDPKRIAIFVFAAALHPSIESQANDSRSIPAGWVLSALANRVGSNRLLDFVAKGLRRVECGANASARRVRKELCDLFSSALQTDFPATISPASSDEVDSRDIASRFGSSHGNSLASQLGG